LKSFAKVLINIATMIETLQLLKPPRLNQDTEKKKIRIDLWEPINEGCEPEALGGFRPSK